MAVIAVARPLREKLGEEGADALVALINEAGEDHKTSVIEIVGERFERRLTEEITKLRTDTNDGMNKLRIDTNDGMNKLRVEMAAFQTNTNDGMSKLRVEMADLRANLIQWMFLFWIGQIGVLTGILFAFFRK
ncbi:MAG: DUF1640 domain-containing protein [Deltaproteobacteria bacterium]|nr:DUF1640 domain-containing protein [Deltaproteobacteria bacterium]